MIYAAIALAVLFAYYATYAIFTVGARADGKEAED